MTVTAKQTDVKKRTIKKEAKVPVKRGKTKKGNDYIGATLALIGASAALLVVDNFLEERSQKKREALYSQKIFDFDDLEMESMDLQDSTPQVSPKIPIKPAKVLRKISRTSPGSAYVTARSSPVGPS